MPLRLRQRYSQMLLQRHYPTLLVLETAQRFRLPSDPLLDLLPHETHLAHNFSLIIHNLPRRQRHFRPAARRMSHQEMIRDHKVRW